MAGPAQDLRHDSAVEGAVEGNNGLVFFRKEGSLDTLEGDVGGDDDEDNVHDDEQEKREGLGQNGELLGFRESGQLRRVGQEGLKAEPEVELAEADDQDLLQRRHDECGACEFSERGARGDTLVEALRGRFADDDVRPGGVQAAQDRGGGDCDDGVVG